MPRVRVLAPVLCAVSLLAAAPALAQAPPPDKPAVKRIAVAELPVTNKAWTGDLDGMLERRIVRMLVVFNRSEYFVDKGQPLGTNYEFGRALEDEINRLHPPKSRHVRTHVVFVPTTRDRIVAALREGHGDIAAAAFTVTEGRERIADFSAPFFRGIRELVVTGPGAPALAGLDDLSGKEVYVRKSSSYREHLDALNARFAREGKAPAKIVDAPELLETEDILEMVNAGIVPITVADEWRVRLWSSVLKDLKTLDAAPLSENNDIAWMIREGSPKLKAMLDGFAAKFGQGTAFGNTVARRYAVSTGYVKNARSEADVARFRALVGHFRGYSEKYGIDPLLMMAQGYQESRLDQNAQSAVGAIGVMQIMPATGAELGVGDIRQEQSNIHGGIKYVRLLMDRYFPEPELDEANRVLFAIAAYNCGPGRMAQLRAEAKKTGLDPNLWFGNVEMVAARRVGAETVGYVSNIYKYYVAYKLLLESEAARDKAERDARKGG